MKNIFILSFFVAIQSLLFSCKSSTPSSTTNTNENIKTTQTVATSPKIDSSILKKIVKTAEEWKKELTAEQFYILREKGTERSFTGKYWDNKKEGTYTCAACNLALFESNTKFKSGTGWPSFYQAIKAKNVSEYTDATHGMTRTEVTCGRCDGHLGHIFPDGPKPTGLRYCINSGSLNFVAK